MINTVANSRGSSFFLHLSGFKYIDAPVQYKRHDNHMTVCSGYFDPKLYDGHLEGHQSLCRHGHNQG